MKRLPIRSIFKKTLLLFSVLLILFVGAGVYFYFKLRASLPVLEGEGVLQGLALPVTVRSDPLGIPNIQASSRLDAVRTLGYLHARDRLFQMDFLRRLAAGRLAEIMGFLGVEEDIRHRVLGFNRVAPEIFKQLPQDQKEILLAFSEGVNAFIELDLAYR